MSNIEEKNQNVTEKRVEIKNFTQENNDSIMNKSQSVYNTYKNALKSEKNNVIKNPLYNPNPTTASIKKNNEAIKTPEYQAQKTNKPSGVSLEQGLKAQIYIPKEKKERERLQRATGVYDLKKAERTELDSHIKLKNKTPDDYYDVKLPHQELNRRVDKDAFGPKTDFSIWNYENNYDKLNYEEQSMMTYKMQREFNNLGYKDKDGYSLKTDGILGDKTKAVYEQYKKDNYDELSDDFKEKQKREDEIKKYKDMALKGSNGEPLFIASSGYDLNGVIPENAKSTQALPSELFENNIPVVSNLHGSAKKDKSGEDIYFQPTTPNFDIEFWRKTVQNKLGDNEVYNGTDVKKQIETFLTDIVTEVVGVKNIIDKRKYPLYHYLGKQGQRAVWKLGADIYLRDKLKCDVSAWMLEHSLQDNPKKVERGNNSVIAYKINNSQEYLEALDKACRNSTDGIIDQYLDVAPFKDTDLYLSINKSKVYVKGFKDDDGIWNIQATLTDTYDFTEILLLDIGMDKNKIVGTIANDAAVISQLTEAITPYEVEVNFYTRRAEQ